MPHPSSTVAEQEARLEAQAKLQSESEKRAEVERLANEKLQALGLVVAESGVVAAQGEASSFQRWLQQHRLVHHQAAFLHVLGQGTSRTHGWAGAGGGGLWALLNPARHAVP